MVYQLLMTYLLLGMAIMLIILFIPNVVNEVKQKRRQPRIVPAFIGVMVASLTWPALLVYVVRGLSNGKV